MTTYEVLGPLRVVRDGHELDLGGRKQRAVLAALALDAGRVVSADRLVDALWGEQARGTATANLQAYVSHLRRLLRDSNGATSPIMRRAPGYLLDVEADQLDVTAFITDSDAAAEAVRGREWGSAVTAAERALGRCRGAVLADLADEEWVRVAAAPLEQRRETCEQHLVTGLLGSGRAGDALGVLRRLNIERPYDETVAWLYAVALHRTGRTADALSVIAALRSVLGEDLGLEPGPAVRDLQAGLLRQDPSLDHWPDAAPGPATPGVVSPEPIRAPEPTATISGEGIVGRDDELGRIAQAWDAARGGGNPWLVITGPPGIGKSRLADEAARRWVEEEGLLATTICPEDAGTPTWWPLRQLVRRIGAKPDRVLMSTAAEADAARFEIYDQVSEALMAATRQGPVLVHVEDVQWADASTRGLLTHLASVVEVPGLAVLLTSRDEVVGDDRLVEAVRRRRGGQQLALPPLEEDAVADLVVQVSGEHLSPEDLHDLTGRTGGNPLFVSEYARLAPEHRTQQVPDAVRLLLARRLDTLPAEVVTLLGIAAVCGESLDLEVLRAVTGTRPEGLAELLDVAADEHVVVAGRGHEGYTFAHALLRDTILASMPGARRQSAELRVAEALRERRDPVALAARAGHLLAAGTAADAHEVVAACRDAAVDALVRWEADESARWWREAIAVHDERIRADDSARDDLVAGLIEALVRGGHGQHMLDLIGESAASAFRSGRFEAVGRFVTMLSRLTGAWPWIAYGDDPVPLLTRLSGMVALLGDDDATRARVLSALAIGRCYDLDPAVPDTLSRQALDLAEALDDQALLADVLLGRAMTFSGIASRSRESLELVDRIVALDHPLRDQHHVIAHGLAATAAISLGETSRSRHHIAVGTALAERLRLPLSLAQLRWAEAGLNLWSCDDVSRLGESDPVVRPGLAHSATAILARLTSVPFLTDVVPTRWEQGRLDETVELEDTPLTSWVNAITAAARRDPAAPDLLTAEALRPEPQSWLSHARSTMLAHAVADLALVELAEPLLSSLAPAAHCLANFGHGGIAGPVGLAMARLEALRGDMPTARDRLAAARALAIRSGGMNAVVRCRLVGLELDHAEGAALDPVELADVRREAGRRGLAGVAAAASGLADES